MESNELNIVWCYPDILNLHGDRGNLMALRRIGELLNIHVNINKIESYDEKINFKEADILFFSVGELKVVSNIVEALKKQKNDLEEYIEKGGIIIVIGTTGSVFAQGTVKTDGTYIKGLGILNMKCVQKEQIYGNDIIYNILDDEKHEIVGNQIQIVDIFLNDNIALGQVSYGYGNNGKADKTEGAMYKNVIFTNSLGPLFVKNPWYAEEIIKKAMKNKNIIIEKVIDESYYEIERKSMECIKKYIKKKVTN